MTGDDIAKLYKTQKSLTEWFEDIKHQDVVALRREDNAKRERLKVLNEVIALPYDKPTIFAADSLALKDKKFTAYLHEHGDELCALRLIPHDDGLPKLRMRGKTVRGAYEWFLEQKIDPKKYRADFTPHAMEGNWATIFVVNKYGIQGEIIAGGHHQLTQGFHESVQPTTFRYDFKQWELLPKNDVALAYLQCTTAVLKVSDKEKRHLLSKKLGATFAHNYLTGYFETTDSPIGNWYIDYSKRLGDLYADLILQPNGPSKMHYLLAVPVVRAPRVGRFASSLRTI